MNTSDTSPANGRRDPVPATGARLLVLLLSLAWGFNWIFSRLTLAELTPWSSRSISLGLGVIILFVIAGFGGRRLHVPRSQWVHVLIAGFCNVSAFNIFAASAQISGATSRAIIIAYSMPIWAALMAPFVLGERFNTVRIVALALCAAGLTVLIWPLTQSGLPVSALYALGCALVWAVGTVYMKWADIDAEPLAITVWQLFIGWVLIAAGMLAIEGVPQITSLSATTMMALTYNGLIGFGFAYFTWFTIVGRLPAITASLGSLLVPVVGVAAASAILGERPSLNDIIGFALIFAAAASVLLQPDTRHTELPE